VLGSLVLGSEEAQKCRTQSGPELDGRDLTCHTGFLTGGLPGPIPVKTHALNAGTGFLRAWDGSVTGTVVLKYPRVTCDYPVPEP
jgi:hypothetical protein